MNKVSVQEWSSGGGATVSMLLAWVAEKGLPHAGAVALAWAYHTHPGWVRVEQPLIDGLLSLSSISVGFLITAKSILISMAENRVTRFLRKAGTFRNMLTYMGTASIVHALTAVSSVGLLAFRGQPGHLLLVGYVFLVLWANLLSLRSILLFVRLTQVAAGEDGE